MRGEEKQGEVKMIKRRGSDEERKDGKENLKER